MLKQTMIAAKEVPAFRQFKKKMKKETFLMQRHIHVIRKVTILSIPILRQH